MMSEELILVRCPNCNEILELTDEQEYRAGNLGNYVILHGKCNCNLENNWEVMVDPETGFILSVTSCDIFRIMREALEYAKVSKGENYEKTHTPGV